MNKFKIDLGLRMKVRRYLEFAFEEQNSRISKEEQAILGKLSAELQEEVLFKAFGGVIDHFPVLRENFSLPTLKKIAKFIKIIYKSPNEPIIQVKKNRIKTNYHLLKTLFLKVHFMNKINNFIILNI